MIEIFEKRGKWCYRNAEGKLLKFATEAEAKSSLGYLEPEKDNGSEEKEESSAEEKSAPSFGVSEENSESESEEE